jgi:GT2 family glycosyltransferase
MSKSKLSIIIVNWKTPELLSQCIDSIVTDALQKEFDIYVVDNASDDNSVEIVSEYYPFVHLIINDDNVGFAKACNQVIPLTDSDYILLLNPDTIVTNNAISRLVAYLDNNPKAAAVGPKILNPDGSLQLACRRSFPDPKAAFFRLTYLSRLFPNNASLARYNLTDKDPNSELSVDALSGSCMMVRTAAIEQVGLLDEDIFMFGEDIDWCWRLKQLGWKIVYRPDAVVYHYHGAASRLRPIGATINLHKGMEVFYRKHMADKYPLSFNLLVYCAIWFRAFVFIIIAYVKQYQVQADPKNVFRVNVINYQAINDSALDEKVDDKASTLK